MIKYCVALSNSSNTGKTSALLSLINLFVSSCSGEYTLIDIDGTSVTGINRKSSIAKLLEFHQNLIMFNRCIKSGSATPAFCKFNCRCTFIDEYAKDENKRFAICTSGDTPLISEENIKYAANNDVFLLIAPTRTKGGSWNKLKESTNPNIQNIIWKQNSSCGVAYNKYSSNNKDEVLGKIISHKTLSEALQLKYIQEIIMR